MNKRQTNIGKKKEKQKLNTYSRLKVIKLKLPNEWTADKKLPDCECVNYWVYNITATS